MKKVTGIKILKEPNFKWFYESDFLLFEGLLAVKEYSDGTTSLDENEPWYPYLDIPVVEGPGRYELKVCLSKKKKDINATFLFDVYKDGTQVNLQTQSIIKTGYFESDTLSKFKYNDGKNMVFVRTKDSKDSLEKFMLKTGYQFETAVINKILTLAKEQNLDLKFVDVKL